MQYKGKKKENWIKLTFHLQVILQVYCKIVNLNGVGKLTFDFHVISFF